VSRLRKLPWWRQRVSYRSRVGRCTTLPTPHEYVGMPVSANNNDPHEIAITPYDRLQRLALLLSEPLRCALLRFSGRNIAERNVEERFGNSLQNKETGSASALKRDHCL